MTLLPRAAGTVNAPPLITVPVGAVVIDDTWQIAQPMEVNRLAPVTASAVAASAVSRGGAWLARMKRAKWSMSSNPSGPNGSSGSVVVLHTVVVSVGCNRLVTPCSFTYASAEKESRLACWFFH